MVKNLAASFYVSEATIRRDLKEMQAMGLIERSHGGAVLPENAEEVSIFVRIGKNAKEKERAATNALKILPEFTFKSVFVDSSSTALALAERMDLSYKTVVTNNLQTAMAAFQKAEHHAHSPRRQRAVQHQFRDGQLDGAPIERFYVRSDALLLRRRHRRGRF